MMRRTVLLLWIVVATLTAGCTVTRAQEIADTAAVAAADSLMDVRADSLRRKADSLRREADSLRREAEIAAAVREHTARYNALQHQMEADRQNVIIGRANQTVFAIGIIALLALALAVVFILKNRAISRKNRILAQQIAEAVNYKKMYWEEKRAQAPTATPDLNTLSDEQLFQYINEVIVREKLFLNPRFERQTIMNRFQLSKERVGTIFSKGSDYAKLTNYVQQLRLEYAAKLLVEQPDKNIVQIAAESGFSSHTYFSGCFRNHFGISPTDFRRDALGLETANGQ